MNSIRIAIREIINEIFFTKHFSDRTDDRLNDITEITFPITLRQELNKNNEKLNLFEDYILRTIKTQANSKINALKLIKNKEHNVLYIYIIAKVLIKYENKLYTTTLTSTDLAQLKGNIWYTGAYNDFARTLLLGRNEDSNGLKNEFKDHYSRKENQSDIENDLKQYINSGEFNEKTIVQKLNNHEIIIDLDELTKKEPENNKNNEIKPVKKSVEIPLKAEYKKGTKYTHPKFGTGTILSREKIETKTENGVEYNYFNVKIEFDQPYGVKTLRLKTKVR